MSATINFTAEDVETMTYRELQKKCKQHDLKANGKTQALRDRLNSLLEAEVPPTVDSRISVDLVAIDDDKVDTLSQSMGKIELSGKQEEATEEVVVEEQEQVVDAEEENTTDREFGTEIPAVSTPTKTFSSTPNVKDLLSASKSFALTPSGKIKCQYTGHEMPPNSGIVASYLSGKKYQAAKSRIEFDATQYYPWLVPSKENKDQLWCTVTEMFVDKDCAKLDRHMAGKRFQAGMEKINDLETMRGLPKFEGTHTVFESPNGKYTPKSNPYNYNVHWTMDDYSGKKSKNNKAKKRVAMA